MTTKSSEPLVVGSVEEKDLARYIQKGWNNPEANSIQRRCLIFDNGKNHVVLITFAFALIGLGGTIKSGIEKFEQALQESENYVHALAKVFNVPVQVIQRILNLEYRHRKPLEIVTMIEKGELESAPI